MRASVWLERSCWGWVCDGAWGWMWGGDGKDCWFGCCGTISFGWRLGSSFETLFEFTSLGTVVPCSGAEWGGSPTPMPGIALTSESPRPCGDDEFPDAASAAPLFLLLGSVSDGWEDWFGGEGTRLSFVCSVESRSRSRSRSGRFMPWLSDSWRWRRPPGLSSSSSE